MQVRAKGASKKLEQMHYATSGSPLPTRQSDSAGGEEVADWALFSTSLR
jgi:hypothetical protein